jgi:hypothetical protein
LGRPHGADFGSARTFFASQNLEFYCSVLGLDSEAVRERARGIVAQGR